MIGYIDNVIDREWKPCSKEKFHEIVGSEAVKRQVELVRRTGRKREKEKLPGFIFCGQLNQEAYRQYLAQWQPSENGRSPKGSRSKEFLEPTGLFMMDFDRKVDLAYQLYDKFLTVMREQQLEVKGLLALAHRTPGGCGLRLVLRRRPGKTIEEDQLWVASLMQEQIDQVCKDLSRLSFAVGEEDIFFIDEELLFGELSAPAAAAGEEGEQARSNSPAPAAADEPAGVVLPILAKSQESVVEIVENGGAESLNPDEKGIDECLVPKVLDAWLPPAQASTETFPKDYDGIPYTVLVQALAEQLGGVPVHGSRNPFIFSMACHLRYVCEDNADWIKAVLPTYGEDRDRAWRTIDSACNRNQSMRMPYIVQRAISVAKNRMQMQQTLLAGGGKADTPPPLPPLLPDLIQLLTSRVPDLYKPCVANAVFPALGAHLYNVQFRYIDNVLREATFMCVLLAKMSVGKSSINKPIDYIMADIEERDAVSRIKEQEWKDQMNSKGANKEKPKRPDDLCVQMLVSDMTNAALVQRLKDANGRFLYTKMDEIELLDQLKTSSRGQQVSQIIRLAFDCGMYGQERVGASSVTARVPIRWNWNASSTIAKGQNYFRNALADGTLSRINFCTIMAERGREIPVIGDYNEEFAMQLRPYIDNLNAAHGIITCPEAEALARQLLLENADVANLSDDEAYESLSFRANVIAYLKAMTLYVAQGRQWDERIAAFVRWSEQYDLWCKMKFFGEKMQEQMHKETAAMERRGPKNLLEELPNRFTKEDASALRRTLGKPENADTMLYSWLKRNYIIKDYTTNEYIKTDEYLNKMGQRGSQTNYQKNIS